MKLKLAKYYSEKYPKGHEFEIENIMRSKDCASGVRVKVRMGKSPTWFDLAWFIPKYKKRANTARTRLPVGGGNLPANKSNRKGSTPARG